MKKHPLVIIFGLLSVLSSQAQQWVSAPYSFTQTTVTYGTAVDFAGNTRELQMDICVPEGDAPPDCGRPVLIAIHGGAFMGGSKNEPVPQQWMKDFAKRGYVTASIGYRLGFFQTNFEVHCNVTQLFNTPWDCSNAADTSEWYRAWYRSVQDTKGAIRYLVNHQSDLKLNPHNIFLSGESAGGFVALGAAFLDDPAEKPAAAGALDALLAPNAIYENECVVKFGWDINIASMQLTRPDLGSIDGALNQPSAPYTIRGVGNTYGGVLYDLFDKNTYATPPPIYMYHQPNDLVVPYDVDLIMRGLSDCYTGLNCVQIINRPRIAGSGGVRRYILAQKALNKPVPEFWLDSTTQNADCLAQVLFSGNPGTVGHSIDNYVLRALHMAEYFAPLIDCTVSAGEGVSARTVQVFPNPVTNEVQIQWPADLTFEYLTVYSTDNRQWMRHRIQGNGAAIQLAQWPKGLYLLRLEGESGAVTKRVIKINTD
jgi:hypothetical protein